VRTTRGTILPKRNQDRLEAGPAGPGAPGTSWTGFGFEKLLSERGHLQRRHGGPLRPGTNNWFAAYAYWYFKLYGHQDVKLLDGGRKKWELESRAR